jgi:hypothetical protein
VEDAGLGGQDVGGGVELGLAAAVELVPSARRRGGKGAWRSSGVMLREPWSRACWVMRSARPVAAASSGAEDVAAGFR